MYSTFEEVVLQVCKRHCIGKFRVKQTRVVISSQIYVTLHTPMFPKLLVLHAGAISEGCMTHAYMYMYMYRGLYPTTQRLGVRYIVTYV